VPLIILIFKKDLIHVFFSFQDRHIKGANRDPQMDSSQDYHLQSGYENKTHTVLRFNRRYDTCDNRDLKITVSYFDK
jgi:hypothetical protein